MSDPALTLAVTKLHKAMELAEKPAHVLGANRKLLAKLLRGALALLDDVKRRGRPRENPGELLVFGTNPDHSTKGAKKLGRIVALRYKHASEGYREHRFDGDEIIELLRDGSFRVYHPDGERLWTDQR